MMSRAEAIASVADFASHVAGEYGERLAIRGELIEVLRALGCDDGEILAWLDPSTWNLTAEDMLT